MGKRLIDINQIIQNLTEMKTQYDAIMIDAMNKALEEAPAVNAVEVVRCKDCAKDGLTTCPICYIENKTLVFINHDPEFYCGYGERENENEEDDTENREVME